MRIASRSSKRVGIDRGWFTTSNLPCTDNCCRRGGPCRHSVQAAIVGKKPTGLMRNVNRGTGGAPEIAVDVCEGGEDDARLPRQPITLRTESLLKKQTPQDHAVLRGGNFSRGKSSRSKS